MMTFRSRAFSGVQPTGNLHLGNYLGAVSRWVPVQDQMETIFCVVDLHAITASFPDPGELQAATREVTAAYIAAGIDPKKSIIFNQSQVPAHSELAWIFNCVARIGWMNRMTQFKDKAGKNRENASLGLLAYPSLMAADILAYKATHVPVGDDQKQHLELTRDIAAKFNNDFAAQVKELGVGVPNPTPSPELPEELFFPMTEPMIAGPATRIMSLRDGTKKMSKSDPSDLSRINLIDDEDTISKKIRKAKTDPEALPSEVDGLAGRPEAGNLVGIYAALAEKTKDEVLQEFGGRQFSEFKPALADLAVAKLTPMTSEMRRYKEEPAEIDSILKDGAERAAAIAEPILKDVRKIIGFLDVR
ncbi:MAG: tryptophan--tRNA ligase [Rhodobacteraceae bacterium]|nr:tryptophan--tRNA ligase [Paracoccaceae bacterium]